LTVEREFTAERINPILNDPSVLPWVAMPGQTDLDLTALVSDKHNVLLMAKEGGGFFFHHLEAGVYEVHSFFLPLARGGTAIKAWYDAMEWMFLRTNCMELLTKVPIDNHAADKFAQRVGAILEFEREKAWPTKDGLIPVKYYAFRYPEWVRSAQGLEERGHWFHLRLEAEKVRMGSPSPVHDDDPAHDRHAGACVGMIFGGQVDKAIILYNRYAIFAGYGLIALRQREPLVVDIGEALLEIRKGETFEVISVRDGRDASEALSKD
jgi:hypothetical protein